MRFGEYFAYISMADMNDIGRTGVQEVLEGTAGVGQRDTGVGRVQRRRERRQEHDDIAASCRRTTEPIHQRPALDTAHAGHRCTSSSHCFH